MGRTRYAVLLLVLGGLFAAGCIMSAPKLPPTPKKPYETPLNICRPPYVESLRSAFGAHSPR